MIRTIWFKWEFLNLRAEMLQKGWKYNQKRMESLKLSKNAKATLKEIAS